MSYRVADGTVDDFFGALRALAEARLAEVQQIAHAFIEKRGSLEAVDRERLLERVRAGDVTVLDVRPAEEYRAAHIAGAVSVPLKELQKHLGALSKDREVVAYCRGPYCVLAPEAVKLLRTRGDRAVALGDGVAGPDVSRGVRAMVESMGIGYHPEHQVVAADAAARRAGFSNGVDAEYDLLVYVPGHRPPRAVAEAGLALEPGGVGVDRHTLATRFEGVYAIGDVTSIPLKLGKPLPKAGVFAHAQAEVVARSIARAVTGHGRPKDFDGHGECFVETGGGKAGFGSGDFYAEPLPRVTLRNPSRFWHASKVLFEKTWLWRWF